MDQGVRDLPALMTALERIEDPSQAWCGDLFVARMVEAMGARLRAPRRRRRGRRGEGARCLTRARAAQAGACGAASGGGDFQRFDQARSELAAARPDELEPAERG